MNATHDRSRAMLTDHLEFELRLIPGVLAVGVTGGRLSVAVASPEAAERAVDLARSRMGTDVEVETHGPSPIATVPSRVLEAILEVPGVQACSVRREHADAAAVLDVTVDSIRAADVVQDLVADALGETFATERTLMALEIPLTAPASA